MKAKLIAFGFFLLSLFTFGKMKQKQGESKQVAKANEVILDNIRKATNAAQSVNDPVERDKLRKQATRD